MRKEKIEKLFKRFQADMAIFEELLKQGGEINGGRGLSFSEKAATLRNLEAEERTRLAWARTWATLVALLFGLVTLLWKL